MTASPRPRRPRPPGGPDGEPGDVVTDALLAEAGRGDLDAFAAFYDSTASLVVDLLRDVLGRPERVERVAEDVYVTLWRDAPSFDPVVRSAVETVLRATRQALVAPVRQMLTDRPPPP